MSLFTALTSLVLEAARFDHSRDPLDDPLELDRAGRLPVEKRWSTPYRSRKADGGA